jgi:hypothetical protein
MRAGRPLLRPALEHVCRRILPVQDGPDMPHDVVGDDGMRLGGRMNRPAVKPGIGRLQNIEKRRALAMGIGCKKSVIRRAEQAPAVRIGQRRRRRIGLERIAVGRFARYAHGDAVGERALGVACAQAASGEFRDVVGHQGEAGAGAGREIGGTTRAVLAGDAFQPPQKIAQEIRTYMRFRVM